MTPLRKRMLEELQLRNLSTLTADVYLAAVARFAKYFRTSPERLGAEHIRQYLLYLLNERKVSNNTLQVHRAALRFLYVNTLKRPWFDETIARAKRIPQLPHVIDASAIATILNQTVNLKHWTIIATLYATALRLDEAASLAGWRHRQRPHDHSRSSRQGPRARAISRCLPCCWNVCAFTAVATNPRSGCLPLTSALVRPWRQRTVRHPLRPCGSASRSQAAHSSASIPPRLCHPHARSRRRFTHPATPARPRRHPHHGPLPARVESPDPGHPQSIRCTRARSHRRALRTQPAVSAERLEVADVFRHVEQELFAHWGHTLSSNSGAPSATSAHAVLPLSAITFNAAIPAPRNPPLITRVARAAAPSASPAPATNGWPGKPGTYCPSRTAMSYSRCPTRFRNSRCRIPS